MLSNKRNSIFFYIIYILFQLNSSYVIINLKNIKEENNINEEYSPDIFIDNLYSKYYSLLNVGYPPQKTEVQFSLNDFGLSMKEDICLTNNFYDKNKSLTLFQTHEYDMHSSPKYLIIVNESIEFPIYNTTTKVLSYESIKNYIFIYNKNITNETNPKEKLNKEISAKACLIYGFAFSPQTGNDNIMMKKITTNLKKNGLIKSENFHYKFYSNEEKKTNGGYDAAILIGENPHEYNKDKFKEENYVKTKALSMVMTQGWIFEFLNYYYLPNGTRIDFGISALDKKLKGWLWLDLNIIIGIKDYYNSIKSNYFDNYKNECKSQLINRRYTIFYCEKNFETKNFPTLLMHSLELNYTFELTHKDLFEVRGDKKYFLIVFDNTSHYPWKLGKLFLQKYFFNFETDSKLIGFYNNLIPKESNEKEEKKDYNIWIWILWSSIVIIVAIVGFYIGYTIKKSSRKKRANELEDDDYEYKQKKNYVDEKGEYLYKDNNEKDILGIN